MDAAGILQALRRRWPAILLCVLAGLGGALLLNRSATRIYEAKALVFVNIPTGGTVQSNVQGVLLTNDLLPSYAELASSRAVVSKVRQRLRLPDSVEHLRNHI